MSPPASVGGKTRRINGEEEFGVTSNRAFCRSGPCPCCRVAAKQAKSPPFPGKDGVGGGPASGVHPLDTFSVPQTPPKPEDVPLLGQVRSEGGETAPKLVGSSPGRVQDLGRPDGAGPRHGVSGLFNSDLPTSRGRPGAHWCPMRGHSFHQPSPPSLPGCWVSVLPRLSNVRSPDPGARRTQSKPQLHRFQATWPKAGCLSEPVSPPVQQGPGHLPRRAVVRIKCPRHWPGILQAQSQVRASLPSPVKWVPASFTRWEAKVRTQGTRSVNKTPPGLGGSPMKAVYTVHWGGQRADDIKRQQPPTLVLTGTLIHSNKRGIDCGLHVRGLMNGVFPPLFGFGFQTHF